MRHILIGSVASLLCIMPAQVFAAPSSNDLILCKRLQALAGEGVKPYAYNESQVAHKGSYNNTDVMFMNDGAIVTRSTGAKTEAPKDCSVYEANAKNKAPPMDNRALQQQIDDDRAAISHVVQAAPEAVQTRYVKAFRSW